MQSLVFAARLVAACYAFLIVTYDPAAAQRGGPSFDCRAASNSIERAICGDPTLSEWDFRMGQEYKQALIRKGSEARSVLENQRAWLLQRNSRCSAVADTAVWDCLLDMTRQRVDALTRLAAIYQRITDQIISELEKGVKPWMKPWNAEHAAGRITRPLRGNGIPYQGINVLLLWSAAMEKGYAAPVWMTFKQASELKANVRKGEHGSLVVYADKIIRTEADTVTGEESERAIPFMKGFTVFNVEQIDGLAAHYYGKPEPRLDTMRRVDRAEAFFAGTGAAIRYGGTMAYYNVSQDFVQMPPFEAFRDAESFYSTLGHETVHWTRHESRLDRNFGRKRFGDEGYAMEELVAELGSAFLSADLDLTPELRDDHASYIGSWIKVLKDDKRAIFTAASHAQRAADFLHALQKTASVQASAA